MAEFLRIQLRSEERRLPLVYIEGRFVEKILGIVV